MEFANQNSYKLTGPKNLELYNRIPHQAVEALGWVALKNVWEQYSRDRQDWIHRRTGRICDILNSFDKRLPREIYDVVFLYETTSALDLDRTANSREVVDARLTMVEEYLTDPAYSQDQFEYVWSVLGDLDYMNNEANNYRSRVNVYRRGAVDGEFRRAIQDNYSPEQKVLSDYWLTEAETLDVGLMERVLESVNLESVIIKAAQLIDDMNKYSEHSDVEMFHKVNEAEYFYAPICEIIGFGAMAATLVDLANQIRFVKSGRGGPGDILDQARQLHQQAQSVDVRQALGFISDVSLAINNKVMVEQMAGSRPDGNNWVNFGDFVVDISRNSYNLEGRYRFKSIGSIAKKLYKKERDGQYQEYEPCDLIGLTIINEDGAELDRAFGDALSNLQETGAKLIQSPNKTAPIFIQAVPDRAKELNQIALDRGCKTHQKPVDRSKFQVAKIVLGVPNQQNEEVGVEIQFLTVDERRRARVKEVSHIIYKYGRGLSKRELERLIDLMIRTRDRRRYMTQSGARLSAKPESLERVSQIWSHY